MDILIHVGIKHYWSFHVDIAMQLLDIVQLPSWDLCYKNIAYCVYTMKTTPRKM